MCDKEMTQRKKGIEEPIFPSIVALRIALCLYAIFLDILIEVILQKQWLGKSLRYTTVER